MKIRSLVSLGALVAAASLAGAQEPAKLPDTKVVLRVSKHLIHRLIGVGFRHAEPIDSTMQGVTTQGNALAEGTIDVKLHESPTESQFDLLVHGQVSLQIAARRRPILICAHGLAPFRASRRVSFDHAKFTAGDVAVAVSNQFYLDDIRNARGGPTGPVVRGLVRPFVRRGLADGDREAESEIRTQLGQSLGEQADKLVTVLNQALPLVSQGEKLLVLKKILPKEGLQIYHGATKEHLLVSVGRPGRRLPDLPTLDKSKRAPIELWIAKLDVQTEKQGEAFLKNWREKLEPILLAQLKQRSPTLAKELGDDLARDLKEVRIVAADGWHVVTFAPKLHKHLIVDVP